MNKIIVIITSGQVEYIFSDQLVEVEVIDNDANYKSTKWKEEEFHQLMNNPDLVLSYTNN